jgi:hypothetical protein
MIVSVPGKIRTVHLPNRDKFSHVCLYQLLYFQTHEPIRCKNVGRYPLLLVTEDPCSNTGFDASETSPRPTNYSAAPRLWSSARSKNKSQIPTPYSVFGRYPVQILAGYRLFWDLFCDFLLSMYANASIVSWNRQWPPAAWSSSSPHTPWYITSASETALSYNPAVIHSILVLTVH